MQIIKLLLLIRKLNKNFFKFKIKIIKFLNNKNKKPLIFIFVNKLRKKNVVLLVIKVVFFQILVLLMVKRV